MWFANWQGSPPFVGLLTTVLVVWIGANVILLHWHLAWDRPPFIGLNLGLSMLAAYAASLSVMGGKGTQAKTDELLREIRAEQIERRHAEQERQRWEDQIDRAHADMLRAVLALLEAHAPDDSR